MSKFGTVFSSQHLGTVRYILNTAGKSASERASPVVTLRVFYFGNMLSFFERPRLGKKRSLADGATDQERPTKVCNMTLVRLIVFDLDETLVHATEVPLHSLDAFRVGPYFVYIRPFASELIRFCVSHFEVAVWSPSSERYVEAVSESCLALHTLWHSRGRFRSAFRKWTPKATVMCTSRTYGKC